LQARHELDSVEAAFDQVAYYPWGSFQDTLGPHGEPLGLAHIDAKGLAGMAEVLPDGSGVAYVATKGRSFRQVTDTLVGLARRARAEQQPERQRPLVPEIDVFLLMLCLSVGVTVCVLVAAVCGLLPPELRQGCKPENDKEEEATKPDNQHAVQRYEGSDTKEVWPVSGRRNDNRFVDLPPLPGHSHDYEGSLREWWKRKEIGAHCKTRKELTELARQDNELYDQLIPLADKRYEMSRIPDRAVVDDLKLQRDAAEVQLEILEKRSQAQKRRTLHELEVERDVANLELETARLEAEVKDLRSNGGRAGASGDVRREIERISSTVATVAGLEQECRDMKERSPASLHPIIDRMFRKEIDRRRERL
jgi:hypothetical protein